VNRQPKHLKSLRVGDERDEKPNAAKRGAVNNQGKQNRQKVRKPF
jgi:hypothetical protein